MAQGAWEAAKLPGDVYAGRADPLSDESIGRATNLAGLTMGGTFAGAPKGAMGAGPVATDPLWHGVSKVKLPRPISEMTAGYEAAAPIAERTVTPAELQGGYLLPALGDRSMAGQRLTQVGETPLATPVELQGGAGYMPAHSERGAIWASGKPVISRIEKNAAALTEKGEPVYFPYTAMGERSVDFSHHVADTLAETVKAADLSKTAAHTFDQAMKTDTSAFPGIKDWPGLNSPQLREYLAEASGDVRNKFAKTMDTRQFQASGFPSVAEARFAVTDPRLLNEPTGASGLAISRVTPGAPRPPSLHRTYEDALPGQYLGGLGASVPKEIMFPQMIGAYKKLGYTPNQYDYLMARGVGGAPIAQRANQQWVDRVSGFLRSRGVLPAVGGAAAAPTLLDMLQPEPQ
jgi:hypothetical protein